MRRTCSIITLIASLTVFPPWGSAQPWLVDEPDLETRTVWNVQPNGFILVGYDLNQNGIPDFFSLRILSRSYMSDVTVAVMSSWYPRKQIFPVHYSDGTFFYIAEKEPTFYAIDLNEDGTWDLMYKDTLQDSVNGNEVFYDSPSGMFHEGVPPNTAVAADPGVNTPDNESDPDFLLSAANR